MGNLTTTHSLGRRPRCVWVCRWPQHHHGRTIYQSRSSIFSSRLTDKDFLWCVLLRKLVLSILSTCGWFRSEMRYWSFKGLIEALGSHRNSVKVNFYLLLYMWVIYSRVLQLEKRSNGKSFPRIDCN